MTAVASRPRSPSRSYRGVSPEERRAERRCRLITAAIDVYGEHGYRQATVKAVCAAAGLTERYFYESFPNSEALLVASFEAVTLAVYRETMEAVQAAGRSREARVRALLHAYFAALKRDPRSARVFLVEIRGVSRAVDDAFDTALDRMGRTLAAVAAPAGAAPDTLAQAGVVGGVIHVALRWIAQGYRPGLAAVTEAALQTVMVLARRPRG